MIQLYKYKHKNKYGLKYLILNIYNSLNIFLINNKVKLNI